jgi:glutathione synthase/RimK-type ligase-like ATP-grasp enzyme
MVPILGKKCETVFMNRLCIVAKNSKTHFIRRLTDEVGGEVALFNPWEEKHLPDAHSYILRATGIYGSSTDLSLLSTHDNVINSVKSHNIFREKQTQYSFFENHQHPCLPWINLQGLTEAQALHFLKTYKRVLVKPNRGQGGWGVEVLGENSFSSWWAVGDHDYVMQPYRDDLREGRLFFIGEEKSWCLERLKSKGAVAANFKQEGEARLLTLSAAHQGALNRLIQNSGAFYGAIDFLYDDSKLYTLELNVVPGIEQLEMITGENIAGQLAAKFLSQKIKVSRV